MITPYKNRKIIDNIPVRVYKNLHKKCYSIKQLGLVVAHAEELGLVHCDFIVSENGRQKVIKENRKNVHAFIEGLIFDSSVLSRDMSLYYKWKEIKYNPYKYKNFCYCDGPTQLIPVDKASHVLFFKKYVIGIGFEKCDQKQLKKL